MRLEAFLSLLFNSCFIQACICDSLRTGTDEHEENCRKQADEGRRGATHRVLMLVVCSRAIIKMSKDTNHNDDDVEFSIRDKGQAIQATSPFDCKYTKKMGKHTISTL